MGKLGWKLFIGGMLLFTCIDFWLGYGLGRVSLMDDLKHCLSVKQACDCSHLQ